MKKISIVLSFILLSMYCTPSNSAMFISINQLLPKPSNKKRNNSYTRKSIANLKLQGIIAGRKNYAIINGKIYKTSDKIGICEIHRIMPEERKVILKCFNRTYKLSLNPMKEVSE